MQRSGSAPGTGGLVYTANSSPRARTVCCVSAGALPWLFLNARKRARAEPCGFVCSLNRPTSAQPAGRILPTRASLRRVHALWSIPLSSTRAPHGRSWPRQFKHSRQRVSPASRAAAPSHPGRDRVGAPESSPLPEFANSCDSCRRGHPGESRLPRLRAASPLPRR